MFLSIHIHVLSTLRLVSVYWVLISGLEFSNT